jgi:uncharacterized protein YdeI (YjbR/CyaY-like superfamily)
MKELPILLFESEQVWEQWLEANHTDDGGIWLKMAKKGSGITSVTYDEALQVALCYGWIDGQRKKFDDACFIQKFTPRRAKSPWSQRNVGFVEKLIEQGRMREPGLKEIERAKQDGRWDAAYGSQRNAVIPDDLQEQFDRHPEAKAFFEQLNSVNRFAIIYRLNDAKKPETRQKRLEKFVAMLIAGEKIYG